MTTTEPIIAGLYRYPVKGLSPERLESVELSAGQTLPFDRAFAIENGPGRFDPAAPRHLPKINFLMLMRDERLASLATRLDGETSTLTIERGGRQVARGQLTTPIGRQMIEQFLAAYMKGSLRGAPKVVAAEGHSFSDVAAKCLHVINLASVRDLERLAGRPIDPLRFRANVHLDGIPAWAELNWLGKDLQLGTVASSIYARTTRCEATNVDPATAERNMAIPQLLQRSFGHSDFGIYAKVKGEGRIAVGDPVTIA